MPAMPIERGAVGPGLLAHIITSKYGEDPLLALPILALVRNLYDVEREAKDRWPVLTLARPDPQELAEAVAGSRCVKTNRLR
jgi:hypothetical protein